MCFQTSTMATLAPAGRSVKSSGSSGSFEALQRAAGGRQIPTSPKSSSARLDQQVDAILSENKTNQVEDSSRQNSTLEHLDASVGVEELIRALPDVLFDGEDEQLTPFTAVYGSPGKNAFSAGRPPRSRRDSSKELSPAAADFHFGSWSRSAPAGRCSHGFGGRERSGTSNYGSPSNACGSDGSYGFGASPASPPSFSFGESPPAYGSNFNRSPRTSGGSGSYGSYRNSPQSYGSPGMKYQPPNRRVSVGDARNHERGKSRAKHPPPVKKNPAPQFNGAGFRSAREIYVSKVHDILCTRAAFGTPWVLISGKDSVHQLAEKPLTIPEGYVEFFKNHLAEFELSPDCKFVAAKMPGEEHACIPPPPESTSGKILCNSLEAGNDVQSLASSVGSEDDDGFVMATRKRRTSKTMNSETFQHGSPVHKPCLYLGKPGGCRAGDACRFSHAV